MITILYQFILFTFSSTISWKIKFLKILNHLNMTRSWGIPGPNWVKISDCSTNYYLASLSREIWSDRRSIVTFCYVKKISPSSDKTVIAVTKKTMNINSDFCFQSPISVSKWNNCFKMTFVESQKFFKGKEKIEEIKYLNFLEFGYLKLEKMNCCLCITWLYLSLNYCAKGLRL